MKPTIQQVKKYQEDRGRPWFTGRYDLNLCCFRNESVGDWGDWICLAYTNEDGCQVMECFPASLDAWWGEWLKPTHKDGCIFIVDQFVKAAYARGPHNGRPAIRQIASFVYVRWPRGMDRQPSVDELEARRERFGFAEIRWTNLHDRVSDKNPDRPATDDTEGCLLTRFRKDLKRIRYLFEMQEKHIGNPNVSLSVGRLKDLT